MAGKRYRSQPSAPVEAVLGAVALVVWWAQQVVGGVRLLVATLSAVVVLGLAHAAVAPVRGAESNWAVLAPGAAGVAVTGRA